MIVVIRCPVCTQPLIWAEAVAACAAGHQFDRARAGYINLWQPKSRPKFAGDSKNMLQARQQFLDAGHYEPLATAIATQVVISLPTKAAVSLLDAGCGTGYYLEQLVMAWRALRPETPLELVGMDLAKAAVSAAARRLPAGRFFVADIWQRLLFDDDAFDVVLNMFAPRNPAEFARVLRPGGLLLIAIPRPDHLVDLRHRHDLIGIENDKEDNVRQAFAGGFTLTGRQEVTLSLKLTSTAEAQLVGMTPGGRTNRPKYEPDGGPEASLKVTESESTTSGPLAKFTSVKAAFVLLTFRRHDLAAAGEST